MPMLRNKKITGAFLLLSSFLLASCVSPVSSSSNESGTTSESSVPDTSITSNESASSSSNSNISSSSSASSSTSSSGGKHYDFNAPNDKAVVTTCGNLAKKSSSDTKTLYRLTGIAEFAQNTSSGCFDFSDSTGALIVYGLSLNPSVIKGTTTLSFSDDYKYSSIGIHAGDEITIEGIYTAYHYSSSSSYYVPEFQGYIVSAELRSSFKIAAKDYTAKESYSGNYYSSVSEDLKGNELGKSLRSLMFDTHKTWTSYNGLNNLYKKAGETTCFYTGKSDPSNREHVWPQAKSNNLYGTSGAGSDFHHVRYANSTMNSKRGSSVFSITFGPLNSVKCPDGGLFKYGTGNNFGVTEPRDSMKGDVARIIAYVYVHYSNVYGAAVASTTGDLQLSNVLGPNDNRSCYNLLRKWNAEDPVDAAENKRNETGFSAQGNRNPFIDHPSYLDRLFA